MLLQLSANEKGSGSPLASLRGVGINGRLFGGRRTRRVQPPQPPHLSELHHSGDRSGTTVLALNMAPKGEELVNLLN